ncbi:gliding motility-associated C-terminal domain-containing protein [uncultured Lutibacter sp.]|uniref:T9SS type B sorting domain-containing protein n=1 Tax=uncultured Lutibacter sp. TaxID=437739 RepID=UPI00260605BA|nr:gliding motility-associated C-terminal domain-containing protein [uncultured Lutibacter sp.]
MEKNYILKKNSGLNFKKLLLTFALFLGVIVANNSLYAQTCTVNANDLNLQYCTNQTMLLGVGGGTGGAVDGVLWDQLSGPSVSIVDPTVIPAQFIGAVPGTYTFSLIADCTAGDQSLAQIVTVTVFEITTSNAGSSIAACPGTYALNANTPGPNETGLWEFIGGNPAGAVISGYNNPNATVTFPETASGVTTLQWTISTNPGVNTNPAPDTGETICTSSDTITLTNYGGQTAVTASGANPSNCYTSTTGTTLVGSNGGSGLGGQTRQWDFVSGPNYPFAYPSGFPAYSQSVNVGGLKEGTYTFRYTVTGPCASGEDTVTIIVPPATQDISDAGPSTNQVYCQGTVDAAVLTGNAPIYAGEIVTWEQIAGPLVNEASNLNDPFATSPTASVTGLNGVDTYTFLYTISGDPLLNPDCSDTKTVTIRYYNDTPVIELNSGDDVFILPVDDTSGSVAITNVQGGNAYSIQQLAGPITVPTSSLQIVGSNFNFQDLTLNGTYTFEVTRFSQGEVATGCNTASDIINIVVSLSPDAANAGTDTFFPCGTTFGPITGNIPTPGVGGAGLWTQISGPSTGTIADPTMNNTTVSGLVNPGPYVFRWSITGGPAGTDTFDDVIIYITLDNSSQAGTDRLRPTNDICPTNYITDAEPLLPGQMGTWTVETAQTFPGGTTLPDPVFADYNNPVTVVTGLEPNADYVFRWTVEASTTVPINPNPCLPEFDDVTVQTNANLAPSIANAGTDQCIPSGTTTATLGALWTPVASTEIGTWTEITSIGGWTATSADPVTYPIPLNDPNVTISGLAAGTYEFLWTTTNLACQEYTDSVIITVLGSPSVANASVGNIDRSNLCFVDMAATSVTMDANTPPVGIGTWVQITGNGGWIATSAAPATYPNPLNDPQVTFSNLSEGAYQFEWQVAQGTCDSDSDIVDFSVYYEPAQPEAGPAQGICYDPSIPTVVNLNANPLPAGSNGTWSVVSGPNSPTVDSPTSPTSSISGFVTGVYTFRWTSSGSGVCPPKFDDVVITITVPAEAGPDQSFCNTDTFLLQGNEGTQGTWTLTAGAGATISNGPNNTATVTINPAATASYTFQYTITNPPAIGGCTTTDTVTITNDALPTTPNAGPDQVLCTGDTTSVTMAANTIASGSGVWALNSGPTTPPEIGSTDPNVTFTGLVQGLYVFEWVASNGACTNLRDLVRVEAYDPPSTAIILTPDGSTLCQLFSVLEADVSPQPPSTDFNGIGTWTLVGNPGTYNPGDLVINNPNNPTTSLTALNPNTLPLGTYTFEWTVSIGGTNFPIGSGSNCSPSVAQVSINYDGLPPAPAVAGNDQSICNLNPSTPETITLSANAINANDTGVWTLESSTGAVQPQVAISQAGNETTIVSGLTEGVYEFKWSVSNFGGGCTLEDIVTITITDAKANADAGNDQTLPQFSTVTMGANNPVPGSGFWTFNSGPTTPSIIDIYDPNTLITGTAPGVYQFTWTVQNSPCAATSDSVEITILPIVDLGLDKNVSDLTPGVGETLTYTITISNNGINDGTGIGVLDELPTGITLVPGTISNGGVYNAGGNEIIWTGLNVADGTTLDLTYQAVVLASGTYLNSAEITTFDQFDPNSTPGNKNTTPGEDDDDEVTLAPTPIVDISLQKTINNMTPNVGTDVIFTLTVTNDGPSNATGVEVTDYLPTGYTLVSTSPSSGSVSGDPTIVWSVGNLANGANETLEITATVNATGDYTNTAEVTATTEAEPPGDSTPNNGTGSNEDDDDSITPVPVPVSDLELTKTVNDAAPNVGEIVTFTIIVTNIGPNTATNVNVEDYLPTGFSYDSHTVTAGVYTSTTGSWVIPTILVGTPVTLTIDALVLPTGQYTNFAQVVGADQVDPDSPHGNDDITEDDQDAANINPINEADLVTTKVVNNANPVEGETITYTIEVLNDGGPTAATGVSLTDILPTGVTYVSHTAQAGTAYNQASGVWTIGNIAVDATVTLDILVTVDAGTQGTSIVNTTTAATGDQTDPTTVGDDLDETITVNAFPIAVNDESLNNAAGPVTITDITAANPTTADSDSDGTIEVTTINLIAPVGAVNPITDGDGDLVGFDVIGEGTWAIDAAGAVTFTPCSAVGPNCPAVFTANPTPIFYTIEDEDGDVSNEASITITYVIVPPVPEDDESLGNTAGPVTLDVVGGTTTGAVQDNDADGIVDPTQVSLVPTSTATSVVTNTEGNVTSFTEPGEGTWEVNTSTGAITFTPVAGFTLDPTPIAYNIEDNDGNESLTNATVTIDYVPVAVDDSSLGNTVGSDVTLDITSNDTDGDTVVDNTFVFGSTTNPLPVTAVVTGTPGASDYQVVIDGEGVWMYDGSGSLTFNPDPGFTIDPTPIGYTIEDAEGNSTSALVTVGYSEIPPVANDNGITGVTTGDDAIIVNISVDDTLSDGSPVIIDGPGTNATITLDATSVPGGIQDSPTQVTVPGEGVWSYDPATDEMTFSPGTYTFQGNVINFTADPTPITYILTETATGLWDPAIVTATYVADPPVPVDDLSSSNVAGPVTVDPFANNGSGLDADPDGAIDITQVSLVPTTTATAVVTNGEGNVTSFTEPGEGTWEVNTSTGAITFTPAAGFTLDPTPIAYNIEDNDGNESLTNATVTIDYVPVAVDDSSLGNTVGSDVTLDITSNDTDGDTVVDNTFVFGSTTNPLPVTAVVTGTPGASDYQVVIDGEGVWMYDGSGSLTFNPDPGFTIDPTPIGYTIEDAEGNSTSALVTVGYSEIPPVANNDGITGVTTGTNAIIVDVTNNDTLSDGSPVITNGVGTNATITLDATSVPGGIQDSPTQVTVTGEGVWTYDPVLDVMTFDPDFGFTADPTPITYILTEISTGLSDTAIVTADYIAVPPIPQDDLSDNGGIGHVPGSAVTVDPFIDNGSGIDEDGDSGLPAGGIVDITSVSLVTPSGALNEVIDADGDVTSFDVPGEGNWSVDGSTGAVTFTPIATFNDDPTPVDYSIRDNDGNQNTLANNATITIDYAPIATDDINAVVGTIGSPVSIDVTLNDLDGDIIDPATVVLDETSVVGGIIVPGGVSVPLVGTWIVDALGNVEFTPDGAYTLDPPVIEYTIQDDEGNVSNEATITFDYEPIATDDLSDNGGIGHPANTSVTVDVLNNDTTGDTYDPTTVSLVDPGTAINIVSDANGDITSYEIPGEGTWNVDLATGEITFEPISTFNDDPTPIDYNIEDNQGNQSNDATVTIDYAPIATDDINAVVGTIGSPVSIDVTLNDLDGDIVDPATVVLDATSVGGVQDSPTQVTLANVGVWTVDGSGNVTFTPDLISPFTLDPPVIEYTIQDDEGNVSNEATITFDYEPIATDDVSDNGGLGHPINTAVSVDVVGNDITGDTIDPTTVSLVDPGTAINIVTDANGDITSYEIPGEGTWNVDLATGEITFDPEDGFILSPTPITYNVEDDEGNQSNDASVTIIYIAQADIQVVKTDNSDTYTPGLPLVYTITVTNKGPANAADVIVNDDIIDPTLEAVTTWTGNGSTDVAGDISDDIIATLNVGDIVIYTVTIDVPSGYVGDIENTAIVALPPSTDYTMPVDPDPSNNSSTDVDEMDAQSALVVVKTVDNPTPAVGSEVIFTITVTNEGPSDATNIDVLDVLPTGYTLSPGADPITVSQGIYYPGGPDTGLWDLGNLVDYGDGIAPPIDGSVATLTIRAVVNESGIYTNTAEVVYADQEDPNSIHGNNDPAEDDQDEATTTPVAITDLVTTKTVDNSNPNEGDIIKYTISVVNNGPSVATGVSLIDNLPSGIEYITHLATGGDVNTYEDVLGDMTWTIGTIDIGESATLTIDALVTAQGTFDQTPITNTATAASGNEVDLITDTDDLEEDITITSADLVTTKTVNDNTPFEEGIIRYTITVENFGPSNATGVSLVDLLPNGVTYVSDNQNGAYNAGDGNWIIGDIAIGETATLNIIASVDPGTAGTAITNSTTAASGDQTDPNTVGPLPGYPDGLPLDDLTEIIVVENYSDIVLTKVVDNSTPNVGDTIKYTITVTNAGPAIVTNLVVTDALPTGLEYGLAIPSNGVWTQPNWEIGNLAVGVTETLTIEVVVGMDQGGETLTNMVSNTQDQDDINILEDDDSETIVVTSSDLVTVKTVSNDSPEEGESIVYSIEVTNNGPSDATGVSLTDLLPAGVTYVKDDQGDSFNSGSGIWTIGDILTGASATLNITATVNQGTAGETIINATTAAEGDQSDPTTDGDVLEAEINVENFADIALTKVVDNATPNAGDIVTYTITVVNNGNAEVTGLVVTDALPSGLTYETVTPSDGIWTAPNWNIGTLAQGEEETIVIKVLVGMDQGGETLTNMVTNSQDQVDSNLTDDDDSETIVVTSSDLETIKTVSNATPNEGDTITYNIEVTNNGPSDATNVSLIDNLPVGVTFVSHSTLNGTYNYGSGEWTIGDLTNGTTATLTIEATVDDGTLGQTIINTTSAVIADQSDSDTTNNIGSVSIVPTAFIDLSLTKWVVDDVVAPEVGDIITFEIRVENEGPTEATGVQVTDLIPSGYDFINYSSSIGTYNPITGLWDIGFIEIGNTAVLLVDVIVMDSGDYINCAEITAANELDVDSIPNNGNTSEDDYDCASAPPIQELDLRVEKTVIADNLTPEVGSEVSFEIRLINDGIIEGTEVVVTDLLPSGYTYLNYSSTRGTYDDDSGKWIVGTIVDGETEVLVIDAIVNADGDYLNCAEITEMHQVDPDLSNNISCIATSPIKIIDLELTKEVALEDASEGPVSTTGILQPYAETNVNFTITLSNNGPSDATGVQVTDVLPNGYNFVSATVTTGSYDDGSGIWNVGTVVNQSVETLVITAYVNPLGDWVNVAEVTAANELDLDSDPNNGDIFEDDMDQVATQPIVPLTIPEGFTPNGDGINDVFEIEFLEVLYPNFGMEIINRYGNKVYEYKHSGNPYQTPEWWDGYSTGRWNFSSDMLPAGTYFYTIYFNNDERKPQTGWIYLRK